jgi:hypothetical protein
MKKGVHVPLRSITDGEAMPTFLPSHGDDNLRTCLPAHYRPDAAEPATPEVINI